MLWCFFFLPSSNSQVKAQEPEISVPFPSQTHVSGMTWGQGPYFHGISNISPTNIILEIISLNLLIKTPVEIKSLQLLSA